MMEVLGAYVAGLIVFPVVAGWGGAVNGRPRLVAGARAEPEAAG